MDCKIQEIIDITVGTIEVTDVVKDWRVSNESSRSDHRYVRIALQS